MIPILREPRRGARFSCWRRQRHQNKGLAGRCTYKSVRKFADCVAVVRNCSTPRVHDGLSCAGNGPGIDDRCPGGGKRPRPCVSRSNEAQSRFYELSTTYTGTQRLTRSVNNLRGNFRDFALRGCWQRVGVAADGGKTRLDASLRGRAVTGVTIRYSQGGYADACIKAIIRQ